MKENIMHCPTCDCAMVSASSQVVEDENGAMTITRWRCRPCHETAEEIWLSAGYRGPDPILIRYAVSSQPAPQAPVAARTRVKGGAYAYACAI
jgi:transposase-like protein